MTDSIVLHEKEHYWHNHILKIVILSFVLIGMIYMSFINFLLFHIIAELFCIIIAITISIISINTYKTNKNQYLIFLGIAYGFIACFDLLHTLTYKGMNILVIEGSNVPTQLWIIARYMESISFLIAGVYLSKTIKFRNVILIYFISSVFLILSVFVWNVFPDSFIDGIGLTSFKIVSEYIICSILLASMILIHRNKNLFNKRTYNYIIASIFATIASGLFFTVYIDVYGILNVIGHILKVISFYLVYRSIVEVGIKIPYQELYQSEERYRDLIELFPDKIFVINEGRIILANNKLSKLLGFESSQQLVGKRLIDCADQYWHSIIEKYIIKANQNQESKMFGEEILILEGREIIMEIMTSSFPYKTYNATLVALRDVSERKKNQELEKSMKENKKLLEESLEYGKMKTEFYSNLSHEMRTPLNLIFSTVQILELKLKNKLIDSEYMVMDKYILLLRQNFYRMLRLVNNLLDITKIDAGYFKLELQRYNIVNVVEEITLSIAEYIEKKNISLIFDTEVEEKIIAIDPNAIERIMLNLLSNAIKFTDPGKKIMVNIYDKKDTILICVKDTGVGIPKDKLEGIFDRFTQVDKTLKRNQQGTGIGLSLVESLVKMHSGEIYVHSEFGEGTEFIIKLPVDKVDYESCDMEGYGTKEEQDNYVEKINIEFSDIYSTSQEK